ncbi:MAG: class I SAM-dependent methyltransferase [Candidatus Promineifilaceae bacterium]|jgi:SAM-dependent methyltransferase
MDYRKPVTFGENWSPSRYKVLPYFAVEKALLSQEGIESILDLGCANGWNMSRFAQYGRSSVGLDVVPERVGLALTHGPVMVASGLQIPLADETFDVVYVQHVLHHIGDVNQAMREARRVLKPGGYLFLVETIEDNPIIHWGRRLYPKWLGDEINAPFTFQSLQTAVSEAQFDIMVAEPYSVLFWMWEILPDQFPFFERFTPLAVALEKQLIRYFRNQSAHCFLVARK